MEIVKAIAVFVVGVVFLVAMYYIGDWFGSILIGITLKYHIPIQTIQAIIFISAVMAIFVFAARNSPDFVENIGKMAVRILSPFLLGGVSLRSGGIGGSFEGSESHRDETQLHGKQQKMISEAVRRELSEIWDKSLDGPEARVAFVELTEEAKDQAVERASDAIQDSLRKEMIVANNFNYSVDLQERSLDRFASRASLLEGRSNYSLAWGLLFCLGGLIALGISTFGFEWLGISAPVTDGTWTTYLQLQLPRLSFVLIVEFIGFFFLKLYVQNLMELRYVHNEITNIESKFISVLVAQAAEGNEAFKAVLKEMASTERNFVLSKGQTTVEIERDRVSTESQKATLESVSTLLHGNGKSSFWNLFNQQK